MSRFLWLVALAVCFRSVAFAQNPFGNALTLDGDQDFVTVPNAPILDFVDGEDFTVSAYFRTSSASYGRILQKAYQEGWGLSLVYGQLQGLIWTPYFQAGGLELDAPVIGFPAPDPESFYNDNEWHHVALVRSGTDLLLYVDGQQMNSAPATDTTIASDSILRIGAHVGAAGIQGFEGQIDEVRLWKVARSETQIRATLQDTLSPAYYASPDSGLIAYYRFDSLEDLGIADDGTDDVRDLSLHGNHGDLEGDATVARSTVELSFSRPRLVLKFSNMDEHVGEQLKVRIIDRATDREVARQNLDQISDSEFEIWLNALLIGHSYDVQLYADHNYNKKYDAPPEDHAWNVPFGPASGNDTLRFIHNYTHRDIAWSELPEFLRYLALWKGSVKTEKDTVDFDLELDVDVSNETISGSVSASQFFGFADFMQLYFSGSMSVDEDSVAFTLEQDSLNLVGKRLASVVLSAVSDFDASLNWVDDGRFFGDFRITLGGIPMEVELDGTIGRTQGIFEFATDYESVSGSAIIEEDSVRSIALTSLEDLSGALGLHGLELSQNYPNPCVGSTSFTYELSRPADVVVRVVDVLGRELLTRRDGKRAPGTHTVVIETDGWASGLYGYSVSASVSMGTTISRQRMLMVIQ